MTESNSIESQFWGLNSYDITLKLQLQALEKVTRGHHSGFILGGEIKPTITQGIRGRAEDIYSSDSFEVYQVMRGGETTLHSPGQLVIYPVFNIKSLKIGVREYVRTLLWISSETFKDFGAEVYSSENPVGLFTSKGKIGFCGLQIKGGVSQHGLSLNIQNDLGLFNSIVSCGQKSAAYDKLENYNSKISSIDFFNRWVEKAFLVGNLQKNQNLEVDLPLKVSDSSKFFPVEI
jgi:lipoyl(octanoyl) transferase